MQIYLGSDHGGFEMKNQLKAYLQTKPEVKVVDLGVFSGDSIDYPDITREVCEKVLENEGSFGVLVCGSGVGVNIAANRREGIRAVLAANEYVAKMSREHNNANVICFGQRWQDQETAQKLLDIFLATAFDKGDDGRHERRVSKIDQMLKGRQDASQPGKPVQEDSKC